MLPSIRAVCAVHMMPEFVLDLQRGQYAERPWIIPEVRHFRRMQIEQESITVDLRAYLIVFGESLPSLTGDGRQFLCQQRGSQGR